MMLHFLYRILGMPLVAAATQTNPSTNNRSVGTVVLALCFLAAATLAPFSLNAQQSVQTYSCLTAFGPEPVAPLVPALLMQSLKTIENPILPNGPNGPVREDLALYIADQKAAIQLGKALFWEMQAGSDSKVACATCHFHAGQDRRVRNQLNVGANGVWDDNAANASLAPSDFPFTTVSHDKDNIAGSQGVRSGNFQGFSKTGAELISAVPDPVFNVSRINVRQVTGKNTPSTVNAVFNHRNFFNGRAQSEFNGVSPWGARDASARVWMLGTNGIPVQTAILIPNASLASQAVGPPLNTTEMSVAHRKFPDLGQRLLQSKPLGLQRVDPTDSVLGDLADTTSGKGLNVTYGALIQQAFQPTWWNYNRKMPAGPYSMMEANFSMYWGMAIMLYESTLVADSSPMDQYLLTRVFSTNQLDPAGVPLLISHDPVLLDPVVNRMTAKGISITREDILNGLDLFERPIAPPPSFPAPAGFGVGCIFCHTGAETTSASVRNLTGPGVEPNDTVLKTAGFDLRMERMFMNLSWNPPGALSPVPAGTDAITFDPNNYAVSVVNGPILPTATYDVGWYNLGVRPSADDAGLGGRDPFDLPLSWTQLYQATAPDQIKVPGNTLGCLGAGTPAFPNQLLNPLGFPLLSGPLHATDATDVEGSFKVPGLRNVELTGPYFHNGGKSTLMQVLEFYDEGGDFPNATKAPAIVNLHLRQDQRRSLVAFLTAFTDERVLYQQPPFDHPELILPNGQDATGVDITTTLPAIGITGSAAPLQQFLNLNPFDD